MAVIIGPPSPITVQFIPNLSREVCPVRTTAVAVEIATSAVRSTESTREAPFSENLMDSKSWKHWERKLSTMAITLPIVLILLDLDDSAQKKTLQVSLQRPGQVGMLFIIVLLLS